MAKFRCLKVCAREQRHYPFIHLLLPRARQSSPTSAPVARLDQSRRHWAPTMGKRKTTKALAEDSAKDMAARGFSKTPDLCYRRNPTDFFQTKLRSA